VDGVQVWEEGGWGLTMAGSGEAVEEETVGGEEICWAASLCLRGKKVGQAGRALLGRQAG